MHNHNFDVALRFVRANYTHLFVPRLGRVALIRADGVRLGRALLWANGDPVVVHVMNGRRDVAEFINTLVHELTHVAQFIVGRNTLTRDAELEACAAGDRAGQRYTKGGYENKG